ncbi:MAG: hypothetical protein KFB93_03145 [Simkaniaceae bacterium]|jgi:hypothetical protein|nr:MAG: hypothetical protein KFB93_03145 [Simkaniaceae bacterium]
MENINNRSISEASFDNEYMDEDSDSDNLEARVDRAVDSRRGNPYERRDPFYDDRGRETLAHQRNAHTMHDMGRGSSLKGRGSRHGDSK